MTKFRQLATPIYKSAQQKTINWFPGHMHKGLKDVMSKLSTVDCIIETHDARIPLTGRNQDFRTQLTSIKPTVLVLNKSDLADLSNWPAINAKLNERGDENILLTNLKSDSNRTYGDLAQTVVDIIENSERYNRANSAHYRVMVVGIPNVGKSTLINRLRQLHLGIKGSPAKVGSKAGVTRRVTQNIQICASPPLYLIDTPGILKPSSLKIAGESYKIALCSSVDDDIVDVEDVAKYLLNLLNEKGNTKYLNDFGLDKPASCLEELVCYGSVKHNLFRISRNQRESERVPDIDRISWMFIKGFREGKYGKFMLDN